MALRRILLNMLAAIRFPGSSRYWDLRYRIGEDSGEGSYGAEAAYKAEYINRCFAEHGTRSVIDFGCGDGNQLRHLTVPDYRGYDVSPTAVERCRSAYRDDSSRNFFVLSDYRGETADAAMSLDVLYHLVEQDVFDAYLERLFGAACRLVIIYAVDHEETRHLHGNHVHHRKFTSLVAQRFPAFRLIDAPPRPAHLANAGELAASFFVYARNEG